jgi:hypothetical protein
MSPTKNTRPDLSRLSTLVLRKNLGNDSQVECFKWTVDFIFRKEIISVHLKCIETQLLLRKRNIIIRHNVLNQNPNVF